MLNFKPSHPMIVGLFSQYSSISIPAAQDLHFAVFALQHAFALLLSFRCFPIIFDHANIINMYIHVQHNFASPCIHIGFRTYLDNRSDPLNSLHTTHLLLPMQKLDIQLRLEIMQQEQIIIHYIYLDFIIDILPVLIIPSAKT